MDEVGKLNAPTQADLNLWAVGKLCYFCNGKRSATATCTALKAMEKEGCERFVIKIPQCFFCWSIPSKKTATILFPVLIGVIVVIHILLRFGFYHVWPTYWGMIGVTFLAYIWDQTRSTLKPAADYPEIVELKEQGWVESSVTVEPGDEDYSGLSLSEAEALLQVNSETPLDEVKKIYQSKADKLDSQILLYPGDNSWRQQRRKIESAWDVVRQTRSMAEKH